MEKLPFEMLPGTTNRSSEFASLGQFRSHGGLIAATRAVLPPAACRPTPAKLYQPTAHRYASSHQPRLGIPSISRRQKQTTGFSAGSMLRVFG